MYMGVSERQAYNTLMKICTIYFAEMARKWFPEVEFQEETVFSFNGK
jgi:hypothetical protein